MSRTIKIDNQIIDVFVFADFCAHSLLADGVTIAANALDQCSVPKNRWLATSLIAMTESGAYVLTPRGTDLRASLSSFPSEPEAKPTEKPCTECNGLGEKPLLISYYTCERCNGSKVEPRETATNKLARFHALLSGYKIVLPKSDTFGIYPFVHDSYIVRRGTDGNERYEQRDLRLGGQIEAAARQDARIFADAKPYPLSGQSVTFAWDKPSNANPWTLIDSKEVAQQFVGKRVQVDAPFVPGFGQHKLHGCTSTPGHADDYALSFGLTAFLNWHVRGNVRLRLATDMVSL